MLQTLGRRIGQQTRKRTRLPRVVSLPSSTLAPVGSTVGSTVGSFLALPESRVEPKRNLKFYTNLFLKERMRNFEYVELLRSMPCEFYSTFVYNLLNKYISYYITRSDDERKTSRIISSKTIESIVRDAVDSTCKDTKLQSILSPDYRERLKTVQTFWPNEINVPFTDTAHTNLVCLSMKGKEKVERLKSGLKPFVCEIVATSLSDEISQESIAQSKPTERNIAMLKEARNALAKERANDTLLTIYQNLLDRYQVESSISTPPSPYKFELKSVRSSNSSIPELQQKKKLLQLIDYIRRKSTMSHHMIQLTTPEKDGKARHMVLLIPFTDPQFDLPYDLSKWKETKAGFLYKTPVGGSIRVNINKGYLEYYTKFTDTELKKYMILDFIQELNTLAYKESETATPRAIRDYPSEIREALVKKRTDEVFASPSVQMALQTYCETNGLSPANSSTLPLLGGMARRTRKANCRSRRTRRGGGMFNTLIGKASTMLPIAAKKVTTAVSGAAPTVVRIPNKAALAKSLRGTMFSAAPTNMTRRNRSNKLAYKRYPQLANPNYGWNTPTNYVAKNENRYL